NLGSPAPTCAEPVSVEKIKAKITRISIPRCKVDSSDGSTVPGRVFSSRAFEAMCRHGLGTSQSNLCTKPMKVALPPLIKSRENAWKRAPSCDESRREFRSHQEYRGELGWRGPAGPKQLLIWHLF